MAAESTKYYVGFDESVGAENASDLLYRNIFVYDYKENDECLKLPFYFMLGKHDYIWDSNGERLLLSACYGFYEIDADIMPGNDNLWTPIIAVADIKERKILKVYEVTATLLWNKEENDIRNKNGLKEFSFEEWKSRYEARKEELEKKANERFKENAIYGGPISGGIVDAIYNGYKESKDESKQSKGTESSSADKAVKRFVIAFFCNCTGCPCYIYHKRSSS